MLKAVLFDLDDTLIDWSGFEGDWLAMERRHLRNVSDFIVEQGHPLDDFDAYFGEFRSRFIAAWTDARDSLNAPHIGRLIMSAAEAMGVPAGSLSMDSCLEAYGWGVAPGTRIFPEVPEVLAKLRAHGVKVGIVTNAHQPMILRDVELYSHQLIEYFPSCRISAADAGVVKPHPAIFQQALDCLGVSVENTVFVGDDLGADIVGAQGIGMRAVLRITPRTDGKDTDGIIPDGQIRTLFDLLDLLDSWFPSWQSDSMPMGQ